VSCTSIGTCSRCSLQACGGPNGSGCTLYHSSDGMDFVCPSSGCYGSSAVTSALAHCGC
jgi:hypothetical protein